MLAKFPSVWLTALAVTVSAGTRPPEPVLRAGDVVFQTSRSAQSSAIALATGSPWTHVGVVEVAEDGTFVVEAIGRVSRTPWKAWRRRGRGEVLVLRPRGIPPAKLVAVVAEAKGHLGKRYDPRFSWGDDRMYCSELVRKAFARGAGLELGKMERLGDLHVGPLRAAIERRWGRVPADLELVTPASIAADSHLERLYRGR